MIQMKFRVNPYYLLAHSLARSREDEQLLKLVLSSRIRRRQLDFLSLFTAADVALINIRSTEELKTKFQKAFAGTRSALQDSVFKRFLGETEDYRGWIEKEWNGKKKIALRILADITKLPIPRLAVDVLITHPRMPSGHNIPQRRIILWGHSEDWRNYSVVYLSHELLHILTHHKLFDHQVMHAIIELATDNELRIRLNGGGEYFREGRYTVGHPALRSLERRFLPDWKRYLCGRSRAKNILALEHVMAATRKRQ